MFGALHVRCIHCTDSTSHGRFAVEPSALLDLKSTRLEVHDAAHHLVAVFSRSSVLLFAVGSFVCCGFFCLLWMAGPCGRRLLCSDLTDDVLKSSDTV